jgi:hypothetical protein
MALEVAALRLGTSFESAEVMVKVLAAACVSFVATACAAHPRSPSTPMKAREAHAYRIDFVVTAKDAGKPSSQSAYAMNVLEGADGEFHIGTNAVLPSQARVDLGLKIKASVRASQDDMLLSSIMEESALGDDGGTIHKITARSASVVKPGQPILVASVEDPTSHRRHELTATVMVLR